MFAEILVHVQGRASGVLPPAAEYAVTCAAGFGATLTALVYDIEVVPPVALRDHLPDDAVRDDGFAPTAATARTLEARAAAAAVVCQVVTDRSYAYGIGETLSDYAHLRDLTILDAPHGDRSGSRILASAALYDSGRPVLFVPPTAAFAVRTVLVGWDANAHTVRAVHDALPILQRAERVVVARVDDNRNIRSGRSGPELCRHLARHGVRADFMPLTSGTPGQALLQAARILPADLLVMGARVHSRLHNLIFGSVTKEVLAGDLTVPVLMSH